MSHALHLTEEQLAVIVKRNHPNKVRLFGKDYEPLPERKQPKPRKEIQPTSEGEAILALQLRSENIHGWEREASFHPDRKWRLDFAWPKIKLAVEIEGGSWARGRHTRGSGFAQDCEKYNALTLLGWRLLRFTTEMVRQGTALSQITEALRNVS